jgi:hypothetical protein
MIIAVDGGSHGDVSIVKILRSVQELVGFFPRGGGEAGEIERGSARGGGEGKVGRGGADAAGSEAI